MVDCFLTGKVPEKSFVEPIRPVTARNFLKMKNYLL